MRALIIIGIIALIFFLIGMIKVGVSFNFIDDRLTIGVIVLGKTLQIKAKKKDDSDAGSEEVEKPEKPKKPKKPKKEKPKKEKDLPLSITVDDVVAMLQKLNSSLKNGLRGFNFDRFLFHVTVATDDPYNTAVLFGDLNQILNTLAPVCARRFDCKDLDVWTDVNFNEVIPRIDIGFDLTVRLHSFTRRIDILFFGLWTVIKALSRGIVFKLTNREEYNYEKELSNQKKEVVKNLISKVKKDNNTKNDSDTDTDERTN